MTSRRRWGKAGHPLTPNETRRIDAHHYRRTASDQEDRRNYDAGLLVPYQITAALDARNLYGPEVDQACGATEPDVDRWEAGELYPTWEQLQLLAKLTDFPVKFFFQPAPEQWPWSTLDFHIPSPQQRTPPIRRFKPSAHTAKPTPIQGTLL